MADDVVLPPAEPARSSTAVRTPRARLPGRSVPPAQVANVVAVAESHRREHRPPGSRRRAPERLLGGHNGLASGHPDHWWRRHDSKPIRRSGTRRLDAWSYAG